MKTILAIETASRVLSVAIGTRGGKVKELCSRGTLQHSENLIPLIDRLLRKEKLRFEAIDAFAIDRGPGSFTGLRIGFSLLKGFLTLRKRPCYGALSLDIMTEKVRGGVLQYTRGRLRKQKEPPRLGVVVDARREAFYSRFYQFYQGRWVAEGKLELLLLAGLKARVREGTYLVGDALIRYREKFKETAGNRIHFLAQEALSPSAATLVKWFQTADDRLSLLKGPQDLVPLYFRSSEAEEKRRIPVDHAA